MIGGYVALRNNLIPFSEWEGRVAGGEASNEVVFPRFDDAFGGVADMVLWGHGLNVTLYFPKEFSMLLEISLSMMWRVGA